MGETTALKNFKLAMMAAIVAMLMGFGLSAATTQSAYADDLQASGTTLTEQIKTPTSDELIYPGGVKVVTVKNVTENQTGTWSVTSDAPSIAKASIKPGSVTEEQGVAYTQVSIRGKAAGKATLTVKFTTDNGVEAKSTISVVVTGKKVGSAESIDPVVYTVASNVKAIGAVRVTGVTSKDVKSITVPKTVTIKNRNYLVRVISPKAFKGLKNLKAVSIGTKVKRIGAAAFAGDKSLKTLKIKTTKLTAAKVKNSLKGSYITTVKVPASKVAAYKKIFTEENCGKAVKVVAL